jgi:hypothetical protein
MEIKKVTDDQGGPFRHRRKRFAKRKKALAATPINSSNCLYRASMQLLTTLFDTSQEPLITPQVERAEPILLKSSGALSKGCS